MTHPTPQVPDQQRTADAGRYFRYMAEFVGFSAADGEAIRKSGLIVEKHLPTIIGSFYTNLLQYPPTRRFFLRADGTVDQPYLQLRMYHQANFWRKTAGGVYDDEYASFVDYVGRAHTSSGADPHLYIAERYVIGMVGFVQHAIVDALQRELREYDPELEMAAVKAWNKLCMVILEMLARAYGHERESESFEPLMAVDPAAVHQLSVQSYEQSLGMRRNLERHEVVVGAEAEIPVGERKLIEADGLSIGVFHHGDGWYAIRNLCLHRGGPVATGKLDGDNIICPWHGYTYDLTSGCLLLDPTAKLDTYPVTVRDGQVIISLPQRDEPPPPVDLDAFTTALNAAAQAAATSAADPAAAPAPLAANEFRLAELAPGRIKLLHLDGARIAVYNVDGQFYATADECTHVGGPLSEGELKGQQVVCPWHFSCFDVTSGEATCGPAKKPVKTYRVIVEGSIGRVVG